MLKFFERSLGVLGLILLGLFFKVLVDPDGAVYDAISLLGSFREFLQGGA